MKLKISVPSVKTLSDVKRLTKKSKLILFAESHGFLDDLILQRKLISVMKPKYYLYEMLEDKKLLEKTDFNRFLSTPNSKKFSIISKFGELKPVVRLAKSYGMKIIGCDLKNLGRRNRDFLSRNKLTKKEKDFEKSLMNRREEQHARIINSYVSKTKNLVFASVGAYHLRKSSRTLSGLKLKEFIICYPFYEGKQIFGPIKGMKKKEVFYVIRLRKNYLKFK